MCGMNLIGKDRINSYWKEINVFDLVANLPVEKANSIRYYFDCGDKDKLLKGNMLMHMKMEELNIKHEFRVRGGQHGWPYWRSGLNDVLNFIGEGFHR
jgi:S-formylglutathione hydrolase FrmB